MPPRYAYWTILVDDQPTAFRAAAQDDLMPTFKRLKEKHPSAKMVWFQSGKIWPSRVDAQEAMRARGEMGRRGDARQSGDGFRSRNTRPERPARRDRSEKPEWVPKSQAPRLRQGYGGQASPKSPAKLEWKPKGEFTPAPKRERSDGPEWKPKSSFDRDRKPEWKPRGEIAPSRQPEAESRQPKAESRKPEAGKRKWVPKAEYKKSQGIEAKRDSKWRPGGEHKDPRQKYKDAKKATWGRFKQNIRSRWETSQGKPPAKKRRDE